MTQERAALRTRVTQLLQSISAGFGASAQVKLREGFPAVVNHAKETRLLREIAKAHLGPAAIAADFAPRSASEDFAYYLQERPGSFFFSGNGESAPLHSAEYRFNDDSIAPAATLWVALAEHFLKENNNV